MKKIAIVDDEQDILNILEQFLSRSKNFSIKLFNNPKNAINEVKSNKFDLIILDIMMPQMDGIDFLKEIKKSSVKAKVIMMTGYSTHDRMVECLELGVDDYVKKPFSSLKDLERKVIENLELC
ncbi:MAG: response regulator [Sphaerochaetaceae bacterium]|nr:response regulator [Sphaerochaetaceae bacterium]